MVAELEAELMERIPTAQRAAFLRTLKALFTDW
jgi:hypothetical protein